MTLYRFILNRGEQTTSLTTRDLVEAEEWEHGYRTRESWDSVTAEGDPDGDEYTLTFTSTLTFTRKG